MTLLLRKTTEQAKWRWTGSFKGVKTFSRGGRTMVKMRQTNESLQVFSWINSMHIYASLLMLRYNQVQREHQTLRASLQNRMTNRDGSMMMRPLICNGLTCPDVILSARLFTPAGVPLTLNLNDALALNSQSKYNGSRQHRALCCVSRSGASRLTYARV